MTYLGLMGLLDPPRNGVPEAISVLNQSGVSVKMLTGDSRETAVSIGKWLFLFKICIVRYFFKYIFLL